MTKNFLAKVEAEPSVLETKRFLIRIEVQLASAMEAMAASALAR
jgi:hypothetical protein